MRHFAFLAIALVIISSVGAISATGQATERRADRNQRQLDRQASRMINRADYYTVDGWTQVNPWVKQYNIPPVGPVRRAAAGVANATERAVESGVNTVDRALFGFNDANARLTSDVWFYDYYTYAPSYYVAPGDNATAYSSAIRYYDHDHDGVYESTFNYRDSDKDGKFDEFDRYDYTSVDAKSETDPSPQDARRHSISGKIESKKNVRVNEVDSLIVRVKQEDGSSVFVDLGPAERMDEVKLEENASIKATGPMERVGELDVLMAETVVIAEKQFRIERAMPSYSGTVQEVKQFKVSNADHTLVVVETSDGNQLIDLGPASALKVKLAPKEKIVVYGMPVRMHDHRVVMASRFDFDGQTHSVVRWK